MEKDQRQRARDSEKRMDLGHLERVSGSGSVKKSRNRVVSEKKISRDVATKPDRAELKKFEADSSSCS